MKKLGLDLGNSGIKIVAGESGAIGEKLDKLVYKLIRSQATKSIMDTNYVVDTEKEKICFGVGEPLVTQDKTKRLYLQHSILLAVFEAYGAGAHEIALSTGLPIELYKVAKDDYKKKLEDIKEIHGTVNEEKVSATFKDIKVNAEGLSAFKALLAEIDKSEPILLVDVGFRTIDIIGASINNLGKWQIDDYMTISKGLRELYLVLSQKLYTLTSILLKLDDLENRIINNVKIKGEDIAAHYSSCLDMVKDIFREIELTFSDLYGRKMYCVGGGADLFGLNAKEILGEKSVIIPAAIEKKIYSNAVGYWLSI